MAKPRVIRCKDYLITMNLAINWVGSYPLTSDDLAQFTNNSKMVLEKAAPLKERFVRYNQAKVMNKNLQKAIMNRSRLIK